MKNLKIKEIIILHKNVQIRKTNKVRVMDMSHIVKSEKEKEMDIPHREKTI